MIRPSKEENTNKDRIIYMCISSHSSIAVSRIIGARRRRDEYQIDLIPSPLLSSDIYLDFANKTTSAATTEYFVFPTMAHTTPRSHPPPHSLLQNLTTQSLLLSHLFTLIASPPNPNTSTQTQLNQVYSALQLSTLDLSGLVKEVGHHQEAYRRLVEKKNEVAGLEMRVRGLVKRLEEGRKELEGMIDQGERSLEDIEKSERGASFSTTFWRDPGANPTQNRCRQRLSWHTHNHYQSILQHLYQAY